MAVGCVFVCMCVCVWVCVLGGGEGRGAVFECYAMDICIPQRTDIK